MFLGEDLLPLLLLAFGAAMALGSVAAVLRPPTPGPDGTRMRPPLARTVTMVVVGTVVAIWALASLVSR